MLNKKSKPRGLMSLFLLIIFLFSLREDISFAGNNAWTPIGPAGGGQFWTVAIDPVTPTTAYATATTIGVMKTTDNGATWGVINNGIDILTGSFIYSALAINPNNPSIVYVGFPGGLYKSTDSGAIWTKIYDLAIRSLAFKPSDPSILYAASSSGVEKFINNGVYSGRLRSTSYTGTVASVAVAPGSPTVIYMGTTYPGSSQPAGIYKYVDTCCNANFVLSGLTDLNPITSIAVVPNTPNTVYAITQAKMYKTTNAGSSWTTISVPLGNSIDIDPTTSALYVTSNPFLRKSTDGGTTWTTLSNPIGAQAVFKDSAFNYSSGVIYYAGLHGLFKSINNGTNWNIMPTGNNLKGGMVTVDRLNPDNIYDSSSSGIILSKNRGVNWSYVENLSIYAYGYRLYVDPANSQIVYAAPISTPYNFKKSFDGGYTWSDSNYGMGNPGIYKIVFDPTNSSTLYAATSGGVYKSTNSGANWSLIGLTGVVGLIIDSVTPSILYAYTSVTISGSTTYSLQKTTDSGSTWTVLNTGLPNNTFGDLAIDPLNTSTLYLNINGVLYKSVDQGIIWTNMTGGNGITFVTSSKIVVDPVSPSTIYFGSYKSIDGGLTWRDLISGELIVVNGGISTLTIDPSDHNSVYATTNSKSVYKITFVTPSVSSLSPVIGPVGKVVTITGIQFGAEQGTSKITFNGIEANVTNWSDTQIVAIVPVGSTTGPVVVNTGQDSSNNDKIFTVVEDTTPPTGTITIENGVSCINTNILTLSLTTYDPETYVYEMIISIDGVFDTETYEPFVSEKTVILPSGEGSRTVYVKFKNVADLESEVYTDNIYIDTTAPEISNLIPAPGSFINNNKPEISAILSDTGCGINANSIIFQIDGQNVPNNYNPVTGKISYTPAVPLSEGEHTVAVGVTDNAGNAVSAAPYHHTVDTIPPVITPPDSFVSPIPDIHFHVDDGVEIDQSECSIINGIATCHFGEGAIVKDIKVTDRAGNYTQVHWTFIIDFTPPTSSIICLPVPADNANGWNVSDVNCTITAMDKAPDGSDGAGVKEIHYTIGSNPPVVVPGSTASFTIATEGINEISYFSVDNVGHIEPAKPYTVKLDKTPPQIDPTVTPAPNGAGWNNSPVTVAFTCTDAAPGSGIASCTEQQIVSSEGTNPPIIGTATDFAGWSTSTSPIVINLDMTAPVTTINCTISDFSNCTLTTIENLSGIKEIHYQVGTDPEVVVTGTQQVAISGIPSSGTILTYYAVDIADNIEPRQAIILNHWRP